MQSSREHKWPAPGMEAAYGLSQVVGVGTKTHAEHLRCTASAPPSPAEALRNSVPGAVLLYLVLGGAAAYSNVLALSPWTMMLNPLATVAALILFPLIMLQLLAATSYCYLFSLLGGVRYIRAFSNKYANGYSIINWPNADLFSSDQAYKTVESARTTLGGCATTFPDAPAPGEVNVDMEPGLTTRIFDLDVAKAFLIMSALVYEKLNVYVDAATAVVTTNKEQAQRMLIESDRVIREQAAKWNLRYEGISDLARTAGPFASVFYTVLGDPHPFIVLVLKGASPTSIPEFVSMFTLLRASAVKFFGAGTVHEGFYRELFPDGIKQITACLKRIAQSMESDRPVQLWVTGHSLGGALASLVFARYMRVPEDLGPDIVLRDAYTYGVPRIGDGMFASKYEESTCTPMDRPNILWRIVNDYDIVCEFPPGLAPDVELKPFIPVVSVLDFAHLGASFYLRPRTSAGYSVPGQAFDSLTRVEVVSAGSEKEGSRRAVAGPGALGGILSRIFLPSVIRPHFPASYYENLNKIEVDRSNRASTYSKSGGALKGDSMKGKEREGA